MDEDIEIFDDEVENTPMEITQGNMNVNVNINTNVNINVDTKNYDENGFWCTSSTGEKVYVKLKPPQPPKAPVHLEYKCNPELLAFIEYYKPLCVPAVAVSFEDIEIFESDDDDDDLPKEEKFMNPDKFNPFTGECFSEDDDF